MKVQKGSITVYLCLTLTVILALFAAMLHSIRTAVGRAAAASAAEQGLYSVFAQYNRELLENYDLFYIDGGYGGEQLKPGRLFDSVCQDTRRSLAPAGYGTFGSENIFGAYLKSGSIAGYRLATDQTGNSFADQVSDYMVRALGTAGIQQLSEFLTVQTDRISRQDYEKETMGGEDPLGIYEQKKQEAEEQILEESSQEAGKEKQETGKQASEGGSQEDEGQKKEESSQGAGGQRGEESSQGAGGQKKGKASREAEEQEGDNADQEIGEQTAVPDRNPIEVIQEVQQLGILNLVVKDPAGVSAYAAKLEAFPSHRSLQQGMGVMPETDRGTWDRLLMLEYIMQKFSCYTDRSQREGLRYQIEYAVGGRDSDAENLKAVVDQLLLIREASNFIYLYTDPLKKAELDAMASAIAAFFLIPVVQPVISAALAACWAFAESVLDIRELLDGGKIPLIKNGDSWQLSLENLPNLMEGLDTERKSSSDGLDYRWYLRFLLFLKSEENLTKSAMDLVEYNMNLQYPDRQFRMDNCVEALEIETIWSISGRAYTVLRECSYDAFRREV